jgi:hypothetical protein
MNRAVAVMRMHLVDQLTLVVMPLGILASAYVVNVLVWLPLDSENRKTGGALALPIFVLAAAMFAVVRGLPFALGMGATRRSFAIGTLMTGGVLAAGFGTLYLVLGRIEDATGGWGLNGTFFDFSFFNRSAWPLTWLMLVVTFLAAWLVGAALASVWPRWGMVALAVGGPALIILGGGVAALVTWQGWWSSVWSWLDGLTPVTSAGWLAALCLACAAATWGALRRVSAH